MTLTIDEMGAFCKEKNLFFPSPEIYGAVAGFFTYGPLGKALKNNVENAIRKIFIKNDCWEVECPTVLPKVVWEASGHLGSFSDAIIDCSKCAGSFRVDKLIEEKCGPQNIKEEKFIDFMKENGINCPKCSSELKWEIRNHPLMMRTEVAGKESYLRPETATATYLPFLRYVNFFRDKTPFGVFQIGKAYRNELSPRQSVIRGREFTQAEGQIFILEEEKNSFEKFEGVKDTILTMVPSETVKTEKLSLANALKKGYLGTQAYAWTVHLTYELFLEMGISKEDIRFRQHGEDEKAHYALDAWDLEVNMKSLGWIECCGIHDRGSYDLDQHAKFSKKKLKVNGKVPHVLEIAFGTDRPCFALVDNAYNDDKERGNIVLKMDPRLAPVKCAIFPLVNKEGLPELAKEICKDLKETGMVATYDQGGSVGKRYARNDEIGTPYCITVDFDSLKNKDVTIRDRDTTEQVRVKIVDLKDVLTKLLKKETTFKDIQ